MISSEMPAAKYASSAGPRFWNVNTTIIGGFVAAAACECAAEDGVAGPDAISLLQLRTTNQAPTRTAGLRRAPTSAVGDSSLGRSRIQVFRDAWL